MCGILAIFSHNKNRYKNSFSSALDLMNHRGPDDYGIKEGDSYFLGHRRLSIQDLNENASQPMTSLDKKVSIIFNGEIYNFKEMKDDLLNKGYSFSNESDTEVIINSYLEYGEECVNQFIGMFAIIIVDERFSDLKAFVIRDRLGVKPLYYYETDEELIFSSEIKSILHLTKRKFELDKNAISSYLSFRYPVLNNTFFDGVNVFPMATISEIKNNRIASSEKYWELKNKVSNKSINENECLEKIDDILTSSIKYREIADVPVGSYLSGGVDSSLITAKMNRSDTKRVKTYTIGFDEVGYNEFEFANKVHEAFNTDHNEIILSEINYFNAMEELIKFKDAPLSVPNEVPLFLMSKQLKSDITVVLSGEGADEIFGGYGRIFRSADDFDKVSKPSVSNSFLKSYIKKYNKIHETELEHFYWNYSYTKPEQKKSFLSKDYDWNSHEVKFKQELSTKLNDLEGKKYSERMMYVFENLHLPGLLSRVDTSTMAASVEARVPFVDHRLVELAFNIPLEYKLKWKDALSENESKELLSDEISELYDTPKYILKKYAEKYLSNEILYRKKMGFPVPLDKWFEGDFLDKARKILNDKKNLAYKNFDLKEINLFMDRDKLNHNESMKIWMILNVFVFAKKYEIYLK